MVSKRKTQSYKHAVAFTETRGRYMINCNLPWSYQLANPMITVRAPVASHPLLSKVFMCSVWCVVVSPYFFNVYVFDVSDA